MSLLLVLLALLFGGFGIASEGEGWTNHAPLAERSSTDSPPRKSPPMPLPAPRGPPSNAPYE